MYSHVKICFSIFLLPICKLHEVKRNNTNHHFNCKTKQNKAKQKPDTQNGISEFVLFCAFSFQLVKMKNELQ